MLVDHKELSFSRTAGRPLYIIKEAEFIISVSLTNKKHQYVVEPRQDIPTGDIKWWLCIKWKLVTFGLLHYLLTSALDCIFVRLFLIYWLVDWLIHEIAFTNKAVLICPMWSWLCSLIVSDAVAPYCQTRMIQFSPIQVHFCLIQSTVAWVEIMLHVVKIKHILSVIGTTNKLWLTLQIHWAIGRYGKNETNDRMIPSWSTQLCGWNVCLPTRLSVCSSTHGHPKVGIVWREIKLSGSGKSSWQIAGHLVISKQAVNKYENTGDYQRNPHGNR